MADKYSIINQLYIFQNEITYYNNYISVLRDFIKNDSLIPYKYKYNVSQEIELIKFHKYKLKLKIEHEFFINNNYCKLYKSKIKSIYYGTDIATTIN